MPTNIEEIEQFRRFAIDQLNRGEPQLEFDELVDSWYDSRQKESVNEVIRQGLADIDAGRGRPAREVSEELRVKYGIPAE